jgi:hypothetical protein
MHVLVLIDTVDNMHGDEIKFTFTVFPDAPG